jgi:hypothetical protein
VDGLLHLLQLLQIFLGIYERWASGAARTLVLSGRTGSVVALLR